MKKYLLSTAAAFHRNPRGNVGMFFGFAAVPIMLSVSAAYDYSRAMSRDAIIQNIVDQAVLSAMASSGGAAPTDAGTRAMITAALSQYSDITLPQAVGGASVALNSQTSVTTVTLSDGVTTCTIPANSTAQTSDCSNTVLTYTAATSTAPATYKAVVTATVAMSMMSAFGATHTLVVTAQADFQAATNGTSTTSRTVASTGQTGQSCITLLEPHEERGFDMENATDSEFGGTTSDSSACEVHTATDATTSSTRTWDTNHDTRNPTVDVDQNNNPCNPDQEWSQVYANGHESWVQNWTSCTAHKYSASFHGVDANSSSHEACADADVDDFESDDRTHATSLHANSSCPHVVGDPFASRYTPPAAASTCANPNGTLSSNDVMGTDDDDNDSTKWVQPGTYCGNVEFHGKLAPGLYVIQGASVTTTTTHTYNGRTTTSSATATATGNLVFKSGCHGDGVTFVFSDDTSKFDMDGGNVSLHAPDSQSTNNSTSDCNHDNDPSRKWAYDGVLMIRTSTTRKPCEVADSDGSDLKGLVYTPHWDLHVKSWDNTQASTTPAESHVSVVANTLRMDNCNKLHLHPSSLTTNRYTNSSGGGATASFTLTTSSNATTSASLWLAQ